MRKEQIEQMLGEPFDMKKRGAKRGNGEAIEVYTLLQIVSIFLYFAQCCSTICTKSWKKASKVTWTVGG